MASPDELRQLYAGAPDADIAEAYGAGPGAYTPAAWGIVVAEATKRGLTTTASPRGNATPGAERPGGDTEAATTWSSEALAGEKEVQVVAGSLVVVHVLGSSVNLLAQFSVTTLVSAVTRLLVLLWLCDVLKKGSTLARWVLWLSALVVGFLWLFAAVGALAARPLLGLASGGVGVLYMVLSARLAWSKNIEAYSLARARRGSGAASDA